MAGAGHRADGGDGVEALEALASTRPTSLFLDIQMPGMTGLEVARQASGRCHVVFVTAYDQHAVAAFEQGAVDYVLKPFSPARLATTVQRLKERVGSAPADLDGLLDDARARSSRRASQYLRWITASQGSERAPHHGRRGLLLPGRQQVHAGGHRRAASR